MLQNYKIILLFVYCFSPILVKADALDPLKIAKKAWRAKLPPCKLCTVLVGSFTKGMENTVRANHDGGDAVWEAERLLNYKKSEVRLVEVLENICEDVNHGEDQCHSLAEDVEDHIEDWWFNKQDEKPDFHDWLCVRTTMVCCPPGYYGAQCLPCTDCNGNGMCKGNGTRKGNGKCLCNTGYAGETCNECAIQYYESFRDESKLLCSECHVACEENSGCNEAGPKGCRICKQGWVMQTELGGCIDVDECAIGTHKCTENQFCVNTDGSHKCLECDRSCDGCSGDGPDLCNECADGYELRDGLCTEIMQPDESEYEIGDSAADGVEEATKDEL